MSKRLSRTTRMYRTADWNPMNVKSSKKKNSKSKSEIQKTIVSTSRTLNAYFTEINERIDFVNNRSFA